jgi:hypothetical protein
MMRTVTVYDVETESFTTIPESELAPGMVRAQIKGREGVVWIDPSQLKQAEFRHPPFEGTRRENVVRIQSAFPDVYEKPFEFWEEGFRRDTNPDREIAIWMHIAEVYRKHSGGRPLEYRNELFSLLTTCSTADPQSIHSVFEPQTLNREAVESVCEDFFFK